MAYRTESYAESEFDVYFFKKNLQGDIIAVLDDAGTLLVSYVYDAWGNCTTTYHNSTTSSSIAAKNPFRYRGYYYDTDLRLYYCGSRYYDPVIGRFISSDISDVLLATPMGLTDKNLYAYCDNNPVVRVDRNGQFWDYVVDIAFLAWSVADVVNDPGDWKNWVALAVDVVFAVVPFVPSGAGQIIKVGNKIDNALDVANAINKLDNIQDAAKVTMIGRDMNRVRETANLIGKADDLYEMWKGFDSIKEFNKPLGYALSGIENGSWMFGKLRKGYTVIDIGITMTHSGMGWYYRIERLVIAQWKYRNIWKLPVNILL